VVNIGKTKARADALAFFLVALAIFAGAVKIITSVDFCLQMHQKNLPKTLIFLLTTQRM
jgi:hypothetical protein